MQIQSCVRHHPFKLCVPCSYVAYDANLLAFFLLAIARTARRIVFVLLNHIVAGSDGELGFLQRVSQRQVARIDQLKCSQFSFVAYPAYDIRLSTLGNFAREFDARPSRHVHTIVLSSQINTLHYLRKLTSDPHRHPIVVRREKLQPPIPI